MKTLSFLVMLLLVGETAAATAQVVQLPSIRRFSYSGGVLVPDRGSVYLGGNSSSAMSRQTRGLPPFPQSGFGGGTTTSGASLSATIIDQQEIDRQLLGQSAESLARSIHQRPQASFKVQTNEIKSLVRNARSLHQSGRISQARDTYDLAIDRMISLKSSSDGSRAPLPAMLAYASTEYARLFGGRR